MEPLTRHQKLVELATQYNAEHPDSAIDLVKYQTELLFSLWARKVDVDTLGFGLPYDDAIKGWVPSVDEENDEFIYELNKLTNYLIYQHRNQLGDFLIYALYSPLMDHPYLSNEERSKVKRNLENFNEFYTQLSVSKGQPIESYSHLRQMLENKQFSDLDLFYLMIECENYCIFDKLSWEQFLMHVK